MKTYSEREVFDREDMLFLQRATKLVEAMPHRDLQGREVRCHEVARVVGATLSLSYVDGMYGLVGERGVPSAQHSWCETPRGHILDVYAVGRVPPVQLVAVIRTLPKSFHVGPYRRDIRADVVDWLRSGGQPRHSLGCGVRESYDLGGPRPCDCPLTTKETGHAERP